MSVLTAGDNSLVAFEVTDANIDYLHAVAMLQLEDGNGAGDDEEQVDEVVDRPRGVHWCERKGAYRVKYKDGAKIREKYFKPKSADDAGKVAAIEEARDFLTNR